MDDQCPKCGKNTWRISVYMHFTAPARFYGKMGKTARRQRGVDCEAALWETTKWFCVNPKCGHTITPGNHVQLITKTDDEERRKDDR